MAKQIFKNLPDTTTPLSASKLNGLFDSDEALGNIVVDGISNKNLIDGWFSGGIDSTTGEDTTSTTSFRTNYMEVDFSSNNYYISGLPSSSYRHFVAAYNANKQFLGRTGASIQGTRSLNSGSFTSGTPQGTGDIKYLKITVYDSVPEGNLKNAQMEKGSSATNFTEGKSYGYVSGSNTNGNYIKYDDGTLIQWGTTTITTGTSSSSIGGMTIYNGNVVQDLPLPVITGTTMSVSAHVEGGAGVLNFIYTITSPSNITLTLQSTSSNYQRTIKWLAIGRWK